MSDIRPRILLLAGKTTDRQEVLDSLRPHFEVDVFEDVDEAMSALRHEMYFAIFADVGDFLPLERALVDQKASLVLNTIGEGVCIVNDDGVCVWTNDRMKDFPAEVLERVRQTCLSAQSVFDHRHGNDGDAHPTSRSRKFGFQVGPDRYFEAMVSPVLDDHGRTRQVVAVVWDASSGRRLQQKIDAIDAAGRELVRLEAESISKQNVAQRLKLLEEKVVTYTSDLMRFDHFIIRLINRRSNKLETVISVGLPSEALEVDLYASPEGNGISGYVAATGRSYIANDVEKDPLYVIGLSEARSSLTVPLRLQDKVIGVFNIESQYPHAFTEEDRQFAEIFGRYIAIALNILDLLVVERYTTTGRLAENVVNEIAGPLNDIGVEINTLMDQYIGDDGMRTHLERMRTNVEQVREAIQHVAQGPRTILGATDEQGVETDPLLKDKRVLVADDEPNIRQTIAGVLKGRGAVVFTAEDGAQAAAIIHEHQMDLVISDIRMPHRDGYEIFAAAKRRDADVPVILMTGFGYDPNHNIVRASQEGLSAVLFKPFRVDQLLEEVRKALTETHVQAEG